MGRREEIHPAVFTCKLTIRPHLALRELPPDDGGPVDARSNSKVQTGGFPYVCKVSDWEQWPCGGFDGGGGAGIQVVKDGEAGAALQGSLL